jgi:hypothetical protein
MLRQLKNLLVQSAYKISLGRFAQDAITPTSTKKPARARPR